MVNRWGVTHSWKYKSKCSSRPSFLKTIIIWKDFRSTSSIDLCGVLCLEKGVMEKWSWESGLGQWSWQWACQSQGSIWTALPDIWSDFGWPYVEPEVGLSDCYGSLPTQDILWFYEISMGSALVAFLPAQAPITFPRNFNFCPVLAQMFSFYFSSDFSIWATSTIQEMYVSYCKRNCFSFPPLTSVTGAKIFLTLWGELWSCRTSTAKGLMVFKVCIDSSEHRDALLPSFSLHTEGRDHQTGVTAPQQGPGIA